METNTALTALAALSQETRLRIFRRLLEAGPGGMTVGRIGEALQVAPATLSFHLKELQHAGLIGSRQESRFIWYTADRAAMNRLIAFLTETCCHGQPELCFPQIHPAPAPAEAADCCPPAAGPVYLPPKIDLATRPRRGKTKA